MAKFTIILEDLKINPKAISKLSIEIKCEPLKQVVGSQAQELGSVLVDCIDQWRQEQHGKVDKVSAERFKGDGK